MQSVEWAGPWSKKQLQACEWGAVMGCEFHSEVFSDKSGLRLRPADGHSERYHLSKDGHDNQPEERRNCQKDARYQLPIHVRISDSCQGTQETMSLSTAFLGTFNDILTMTRILGCTFCPIVYRVVYFLFLATPPRCCQDKVLSLVQTLAYALTSV